MISTSKQNVIERRRPPRLRITYDIEFTSGPKNIELPFVMGVMAGLAAASESREAKKIVSERDFVEVDAVRFEDFMQSLAPRVRARVPNRLPANEGGPAGAELEIDLSFKSMGDFAPDQIAEQVPALAVLLRGRRQLMELLGYLQGKRDPWEQIARFFASQRSKGQGASPAATAINTEELGPESSAVAATSNSDAFWNILGQDLQSDSAGGEQLQSLVQICARAGLQTTDQVPVSGDALGMMNSLVERIDWLLSAQVNEIMHCDELREIEGTWRGLYYLVSLAETDQHLKIRVMNITKDELDDTLEDFEGQMWDQSPIFRKVYADEYGILGGEPFGAIVGAYEFSHQPRDVSLLRSLSRICATAHAPFIAAASPALFGMKHWQELPAPWDLKEVMSSPDYASWQSLRESEDSRYIGLTMPRLLARLPYGAATVSVDGFAFEEELGGLHDHYVWMNAAFALGVNINRSHKLYGWGTQIRGVGSGGTVINLPAHTFLTDDGSVATRRPTEIAMDSDRLEPELSKFGLIPLIHRRNTNLAVFFSAHSLQDDNTRAARHVDLDAQSNERLSANLPYLFPVCRFAHYLKSIARDRIGFFKDRSDMEQGLNEWINRYVLAEPAIATEEEMVRQPLIRAEVQIDNLEVRPGYNRARFVLCPHYQLEGIGASLRLVSELPAAIPH